MEKVWLGKQATIMEHMGHVLAGGVVERRRTSAVLESVLIVWLVLLVQSV
jgi:hypothetical protein